MDLDTRGGVVLPSARIVEVPAVGAQHCWLGAEHALAKAPLVQALPDHRGDVQPPRGQRRRVVDCQAAGAPIWSSIATTKLRVSGWS